MAKRFTIYEGTPDEVKEFKEKLNKGESVEEIASYDVEFRDLTFRELKEINNTKDPLEAGEKMVKACLIRDKLTDEVYARITNNANLMSALINCASTLVKGFHVDLKKN